MSKNHRGAGIRTLPNSGRGKCPICGKDNIKVLYEKEVDGQKLNICKYSRKTIYTKSVNLDIDGFFLYN